MECNNNCAEFNNQGFLTQMIIQNVSCKIHIPDKSIRSVKNRIDSLPMNLIITGPVYKSNYYWPCV